MLLHILFVIGGIGLGLASALAIHELGHFAFAAVASIPVRQVSIGAGPLLLRTRLGTIDLDLRAVPISGFVQPAIYENVRKSRTILFVLGGILANAALFGVLLILDRVLPLSTSAQFALIYPVAGAQVWVAFWSLVPARHAIDGDAVGSDGLQLIQILCGTHGSDAVRFYRRRLQRYGATAVGQISASAPLIMEQLARTERWTNPWARNDFLEALQGLLASGALATRALARAEEMLVLDALVTTGLVTGDAEFRVHLDGWTRRAAELGPDVATLKGSRGAVLVELGQYAAGKALLAQLAAADGIRASDAALVDIFLARAERALGDAAAAQRHADAARQAVDRDATLAWLRPLLARDSGGAVAAAAPEVPAFLTRRLAPGSP